MSWGRKTRKNIWPFWGSGKFKVQKNKLYEQENLQLNIKKAQKYLNWSPTYKIKDSVKLTTEWYHRVFKLKEIPEQVTLDQIKRYEKDSKIN